MRKVCPMKSIPNCLTIAGSDPSGGAGIQADLKTFSAHGCYGMSVITGLTAQNTCGVQDIYSVTPEFVLAQLQSIFDDIQVDSIKIGMLGTSEIVREVAKFLTPFNHIPIILDPVMNAKSGDDLLQPDAVKNLISDLIPQAQLVTPNLPEVSRIIGTKVTCKDSMVKAGEAMLSLGAKAALIKGGHLNETKDDLLVTKEDYLWISGHMVKTKNTHGTGCTLSSAIAAYVAKGFTIKQSVLEAKSYITRALEGANSLQVGRGIGPTHHFVSLWEDKRP